MKKPRLENKLLNGDSGKGICLFNKYGDAHYLISTKILAEEKGVSEGTIKNWNEEHGLSVLLRSEWPKNLEPEIHEFHKKNNHSRSQKTMYRLWKDPKNDKLFEQSELNEGENYNEFNEPDIFLDN